MCGNILLPIQILKAFRHSIHLSMLKNLFQEKGYLCSSLPKWNAIANIVRMECSCRNWLRFFKKKMNATIHLIWQRPKNTVLSEQLDYLTSISFHVVHISDSSLHFSFDRNFLSVRSKTGFVRDLVMSLRAWPDIHSYLLTTHNSFIDCSQLIYWPNHCHSLCHVCFWHEF